MMYPDFATKTSTSSLVLEKKDVTVNRWNTIANNPLQQRANRMAKRAFDLLFSSLFMIFVFSWVFPIVAILIKLTSKGPIFFKQDRHGLGNELFKCWKFRTMEVNNEEGTQATKNDPRVTPVGAFLRKTSIDELPQFINVFLGSMSVVGPRPHFYKHNEEFAEQIDGFMDRHMVKPGVTGLAQTRGYRGETDTFQAITGRFKLDRFYIENWTFIMDVKITINTFLGMLLGDKNAY